MANKLVVDQIYSNISDSDKKLSEQLKDDSQDISDSSHVNKVLPINTSILHISTEFVTDVVVCGSLCGSISTKNILIPPLKLTHTPQFSDNSTIPSIPTNCNILQLANIVDKSSAKQDTKKIDA